MELPGQLRTAREVDGCQSHEVPLSSHRLDSPYAWLSDAWKSNAKIARESGLHFILMRELRHFWMDTGNASGSDVLYLQTHGIGSDEFGAESKATSQAFCGEITLSELLQADGDRNCGSRASYSTRHSQRLWTPLKSNSEQFTGTIGKHAAWDSKRHEAERPTQTEDERTCDDTVSMETISMATGCAGSADHVAVSPRSYARDIRSRNSGKRLPLLNDANIRKDLRNARQCGRKPSNNAREEKKEDEEENWSCGRSVCVSGRAYTHFSRGFRPLRPFLPQLTLSQCGDVDSAVIEVVRDHNDPNRGVTRSIQSPFN